MLDKISKLQDEKCELIDAIENFKKDYHKEQDQLRYVLERLGSMRGSMSLNISGSVAS